MSIWHRMQERGRRPLALLLAFALATSMVPTSAFAERGTISGPGYTSSSHTWGGSLTDDTLTLNCIDSQSHECDYGYDGQSITCKLIANDMDAADYVYPGAGFEGNFRNVMGFNYEEYYVRTDVEGGAETTERPSTAGTYKLRVHCTINNGVTFMNGEGGLVGEFDLTTTFTLNPGKNPSPAAKTVHLDWDATGPFVANGREQGPTATVRSDDGDDVSGITLYYKGYGSEAGPHQAEAVLDGDCAGFVIAESDRYCNYTILAAAPTTVHIEWPSNTHIAYTGEQPKDFGEIKDKENIPGAENLHVGLQNFGKDAKTYEVRAVLYGEGAENFTIAEGEETKTYTIDPKKLTFDWQETSYNYDGSPHKPKASTADVIPGDDLSWTFDYEGGDDDGWITAAGATATATIRLEGNDAHNYTIDEADVSRVYRIIGKTVHVDWADPESGYTFDGTEQGPTPTLRSDEYDVSQLTVSASKFSAAGEHTATATIEGEGAAEFCIAEGEGSKTFTITPRTVGIAWDDNASGYDSDGVPIYEQIQGYEQGPRAEGKLPDSEEQWFIAEDDVQVVTDGRQAEAGENLTATARLSGANAGNYQLVGDQSTRSYKILPRSTKIDELQVEFGTVSQAIHDDVTLLRSEEEAQRAAAQAAFDEAETSIKAATTIEEITNIYDSALAKIRAAHTEGTPLETRRQEVSAAIDAKAQEYRDLINGDATLTSAEKQQQNNSVDQAVSMGRIQLATKTTAQQLEDLKAQVLAYAEKLYRTGTPLPEQREAAKAEVQARKNAVSSEIEADDTLTGAEKSAQLADLDARLQTAEASIDAAEDADAVGAAKDAALEDLPKAHETGEPMEQQRAGVLDEVRAEAAGAKAAIEADDTLSAAEKATQSAGVDAAVARAEADLPGKANADAIEAARATYLADVRAQHVPGKSIDEQIEAAKGRVADLLEATEAAINADATLTDADKATQREQAANEATRINGELEGLTTADAIAELLEEAEGSIAANHQEGMDLADRRAQAKDSIFHAANSTKGAIEADPTLTTKERQAQLDAVDNDALAACAAIDDAATAQQIVDAQDEGLGTIAAEHARGKDLDEQKAEAKKAVDDAAAAAKDAIAADVTLTTSEKNAQADAVDEALAAAEEAIEAAENADAINAARDKGTAAAAGAHESGTPLVEQKAEAKKAAEKVAADAKDLIADDATLTTDEKCAQADSVDEALAAAEEAIEAAEDADAINAARDKGSEAAAAAHEAGTPLVEQKAEAGKAIDESADDMAEGLSKVENMSDATKARAEKILDNLVDEAKTAIHDAKDAQGIADATSLVAPKIGTIDVADAKGEGASLARFGADDAKVAEVVFDDDDLEHLFFGETLSVWMQVVDITESASEADVALISAVDGQTMGAALDISIFKKTSSATEATKVTELSEPLALTVNVPESLRNVPEGTTRTFGIVRVHDGKAELIDSTYDAETGTITFGSDKFSTYAIVFADQVKPSEDDGQGQQGSGDQGQGQQSDGQGQQGSSTNGQGQQSDDQGQQASGTDAQQASGTAAKNAQPATAKGVKAGTSAKAARRSGLPATGDVTPLAGLVFLSSAFSFVGAALTRRRRKSNDAA